MKRSRPFRTLGRFYRYGEVVDHKIVLHFRCFSTFKRALTGVRLDLAQIEADGTKPPLWTAIWYEHPRKRGQNVSDSEIVAVWKRGRFVWVDPIFKAKEKDNVSVHQRVPDERRQPIRTR